MRSCHLPLSLAVLAALTACDEPAPTAVDSGPALAASGPATLHRDIMEFVDHQGTYCTPAGGELGVCTSLLPEVPDVVGWCNWAYTWCGFFDFAGVYDRWATGKFGAGFGTAYSGTITEHHLADGRARVRVVLETTGAFTYVMERIDQGNDFNYGTPSLGYSSLEWNPALRPVLGEHRLVLEYDAPAPGAPVPDLVELFWPVPGAERGYGFRSLMIVGKAAGPLRTEAGYAPGSTGSLEWNAPTPAGAANGQYRNLVGGKITFRVSD